MLDKKFKQFGIWMDTKHATVVGVSQNDEADGFKVMAHVKATYTMPNSSESHYNNDKERNEHGFFKDIATHLQNAEEVYLTGYGKAQEAFSHYLQDTAQFKNTTTMLDTDEHMSDDALVAKVKEKFHG